MPYKYSFVDHDTNHEFECSLQCNRCKHRNPKTKQQCNRQTCIGVTLCWQHTLLDLRIQIKTSTIAGAGKGLFAIVKSARANEIIFNEDDIICEYTGEVLTS